MKNLLHDIQVCMMLVLMMASIQSCSDDVQESDYVEVNFTATLPTDAHTRSFGKAEQVNTLIVGVFDEWKNEIDRKSFPIEGTSVDICLALAQNQTYDFVFWAYDNNQIVYDITDLTAIRMQQLPESVTFREAESMDAFFGVKEGITVTAGKKNYPVELVRPLAQINVGTTGKPMCASFKVMSVPDTFYPFENTVDGETDYTWNFSEITTDTFPVEKQVFNYLAVGYLFAPPVTAKGVVTELTLTDEEGNSTKVEFPEVEIKANNRTNIAGSFTAK